MCTLRYNKLHPSFVMQIADQQLFKCSFKSDICNVIFNNEIFNILSAPPILNVFKGSLFHYWLWHWHVPHAMTYSPRICRLRSKTLSDVHPKLSDSSSRDTTTNSVKRFQLLSHFRLVFCLWKYHLSILFLSTMYQSV